MTLEEMKVRKRELGYTNEQLSELSGVPLGTVIKIFEGATTSPRRATITALEAVLQSKTPGSYRFPNSQPDVLKDSSVSYGSSQKKYTLDDYYAWPDDERIELIDGRIYDMAAPTTGHQLVIGELMWQFMNCQREHGETCQVIVSPVDVQLDCDERTMVQPDIVILCDEEKLTRRCIYGAPDFVLEVLSGPSRSKDMVKKHEKYFEAGCREYWIIDTEREEVLVSDFEREDFYNRYTFDDRVPVRISEGRCEIDFRQVRERMI